MAHPEPEPKRPHAVAHRQVRRASPAATEHPAAEHHHHHHRPHKHKKAWILPVSICVGVFVLVLVVMRLSGAGSYFREEANAENLLTQAESQLAAGELSRALDSCKLAELRGPDDNARQRIQTLRTRIEGRAQRDKDQPLLDVARRTLEAMQQFETQYLATAQPRPAVRDLARTAQQWLQRYSDVASRYPDAAADVPKVQALVTRYVPLAQLERPDDASDVLFGVQRRLTMPRPLYRDAMTLIEDYVRAHPNDPGAAELKSSRAAVTKAAREEFDRREAAARRLLADKRFDEARKEVDAMRDAIVDDSWGKLANAVDEAIQRAAK